MTLGVEVLQQWKGEHHRRGLERDCQCCGSLWPCPMFRLVEQIEELRAKLENMRQHHGCLRSGCEGCVEAAEALTLSKLEAR